MAKLSEREIWLRSLRESRPVIAQAATVTPSVPRYVDSTPVGPRFDRTAYQREYMRGYRARQKEKANASDQKG